MYNNYTKFHCNKMGIGWDRGYVMYEAKYGQDATLKMQGKPENQKCENQLQLKSLVWSEVICMEIIDEKVNALLPYYSTLKKFWNVFLQTFQANIWWSLPGDHPFAVNF